MRYRIVPVTRFRQNCSLLWCPDSLRAAVVDPGGDLDLIRAAIAEEGVAVEKILVTHGPEQWSLDRPWTADGEVSGSEVERKLESRL